VKQWLQAHWKMLIISIMFILLTSAQTVSLPIWINALFIGTGKEFSGPYVVLFYTSLALALCNAIVVLIYWILFRPSSPPFLENCWYYFVVGLSLAINGVLLVYASPSNRTPEIMQSILLNTGFIWSIPASKFLVEEKSKYKFCTWPPVLSILCVVWGVVISLTPLIVQVCSGKEPIFANNGGIIWSLIFTLSIAPAALSNVFQERFFKKQALERQELRNHVFDVFLMNLWSTVVQLFVIICLFWLDLIRVIGYSSSLANFGEKFVDSSLCLFNAVEGCTTAWYLGLIFIFSFELQNIMSTFLNSESANFVNIAMTLQVPVSTLFWYIFPKLYTSQYIPPPEYIAPAVLLLLVGSYWWKVWETQEQERLAKVWDYSINYFM